MEQTLNQFLTTGVFAFILVFVRIGAAMFIMPGIGDSFVTPRIRIFIALSMSLVLAPIVYPYLPNPIPPVTMLAVLIGMEFIVGLFIGTIARIFMSALDTAGMIMSMQSGLGNAQLFNPAFMSQGSLLGALLSISGVVLIFVTNLHHLLFLGLVGSYEMFPVGEVPDSGSMAELVTSAVASSFLIGVQISSPFLVVGLLMYIGMGVLTRLMPQVQIFMVAIPLQIAVSLITLALVVSAGLLFWLSRFEDSMMYFMSSAG
jgi:flagellar biosynthetic protein FliR